MYSSALTYIDELLAAKTLPPEVALRSAVRQEQLGMKRLGEVRERRPDTLRLVIAAAVLDDETLFMDAVAYDYAADHRSYCRQRDDGMPEEDLGPEPSQSISAARLRRSAQQYMDEMPDGIKERVWPRIEHYASRLMTG